jgi:hypothetical protein
MRYLWLYDEEVAHEFLGISNKAVYSECSLQIAARITGVCSALIIAPGSLCMSGFGVQSGSGASQLNSNLVSEFIHHSATSRRGLDFNLKCMSRLNTVSLQYQSHFTDPPLARYCQRSYAYIHLHSSLCAVSPSSITRRFAVRRIAETKCLARCANSGRCELNAFTGRYSRNDCIVLVWEYCSCSGVGMGWDGVRQCGGGVWNVDVYVFYTSSTDPLQFQINGCYNCFKDVACK